MPLLTHYNFNMTLFEVLPVVAGATPTRPLCIMYITFILSTCAVYFGMAKMEFSSILTLSGMCQCFAIVLLAMQPLRTGTVSGISLSSLLLHAVSFGCRLSGTTWLNGYLPMDATGDWFYQAVDVFTLFLTVCLFCRVLAGQKSAWQAVKTIATVIPIMLLALALAALLHADLDLRPVYDTLWMAGTFMGAAAVLPQLWQTSSKGLSSSAEIQAEALASHSVTAMCMGQLLNALYMWYARNDVTYSPLVEGVNHPVWAIITAHILPVLFVCDFSSLEMDT